MLTPDELLTTTRSVRKRLDLTRPVPLDLVRECLEIATQAPSGSNSQQWHWIVITDPAVRAQVGDYYRRATQPYLAASRPADDAGARIKDSAAYLGEHMGEVPVLVLACIEVQGPWVADGNQAGLWGSLLPAAWSYMLACRSRGLGTAWTTLHLTYERDVAELLGIPGNVRQGVLIPTAYYTGETFRPAPRRALPLHEDRWLSGSAFRHYGGRLFTKFMDMPDEASMLPPAEDEFDRALRELTEKPTTAARFHEPSAAERAEAAARQAGHARQQARLTNAASRQFRRRQARKAVAWTAAIVVVAGVVALGWRHFGGVTKGSPSDTGLVSNGAVPALSASPGGPGSSRPSGALAGGIPADGGPPANPFATTPAAHWANGAAGIVLPVPEPTRSFTAAQVDAAYVTTRNLLIAQNLDRTTLLGGAPTAFANLLDPKQRAQFTPALNKVGLAKDGTPLSSRAWVASFAPGTTALVGSVIKVHGTMSAREATDRGSEVLEIEVNYRFVYAVEPPRAPQDWMRIVGQVNGSIEFTSWDSGNGSLLPWVTSAFPAEAGGRCAMADGYIHPDYPNGPPDKVAPSGKPIDPYSMAIPKDTSNSNCTMTTGT